MAEHRLRHKRTWLDGLVVASDTKHEARLEKRKKELVRRKKVRERRYWNVDKGLNWEREFKRLEEATERITLVEVMSRENTKLKVKNRF